MKPDERAFLLWSFGYWLKERLVDSREYSAIPLKRKIYLIDKWTDKGWVNWGTSENFFWFEQKGIEKISEVLNIS